MCEISHKMTAISPDQSAKYQQYISKKELLLRIREHIQDSLNHVDKELEAAKEEFKPFCFHPIKTDPRFNVCALCYKSIE